MENLHTHLRSLERPEHRAYLAGLAAEHTALGYATTSVRADGWRARRFLEWTECVGAGWVELTTTAELVAYREHVRSVPSLRDGGPISEVTVYRLLRTVQLLFDYLLEHGMVAADPFARFRMNRPRRGAARAILTREEIELLYENCERLGERALLALTYGCALRVGELERLNVADVKLGDGLVVVEKGKRDKRRLVPMSPGVRRDLEAYAGRSRSTASEPAFLRNGQGGRLRRHTAQIWLQRLARRAGITKTVSVHVMRHTIASHLLDGGLPVEEVRVFLGHALLATTERYTRVSAEAIKKVVEG